MKEIRIAVNNTLLCLDSYINDLECDVNMLRELEIAYRDKKEYAIEKAYKEIICQNLINTNDKPVTAHELLQAFVYKCGYYRRLI